MAKNTKTTRAATPSIKMFQPDETQPNTAPTSKAPVPESACANQIAGAASEDAPNLVVANLEELITQAEYKQHPYGKSWHPFDGATFSELVSNVDRRGLDKEIVLYQDMVLEGWHRYLACLATKTKPKFTPFKGTDLQAAELVHASGIRRHSTPEQRYASLDLLCDACPEFKARFEEMKAMGEQRQKAGTPLATGNQRVDVIQAKADAAGVGKSTAKKVEKVKKTNPKEPRKIKLVKLILLISAVMGTSAACMMQLLSNGFEESSKPLLLLWTSGCGGNGQLQRRWSWLGVVSAA